MCSIFFCLTSIITSVHLMTTNPDLHQLNYITPLRPITRLAFLFQYRKLGLFPSFDLFCTPALTFFFFFFFPKLNQLISRSTEFAEKYFRFEKKNNIFLLPSKNGREKNNISKKNFFFASFGWRVFRLNIFRFFFLLLKIRLQS